MHLSEIAKMLSCQLEGGGDIEINGVATLEDANAGDLSFFTNPRYSRLAKTTRASALIVGKDCPALPTPVLRHHNPYLTFAKAIELFIHHENGRITSHIHPTAWIEDSAVMGQSVSVGANSYIGARVVIGNGVVVKPGSIILEDASIGEGSTLHSGCVIRERVQIGKRCIVQNNAVVGSDGFGYAQQDDQTWYKIAPSGTVVIEDDVEIGACTTIDRATLGETRVRSGSKLDNLVQIGHGCQIGPHNLICAQVGMAGSTRTGRHVILAGQVGASGHLTLGDGVMATGQTGIQGSIEAGKVISGSPSIDNRQWLRSTAVFARLPELQREVRSLATRLSELENHVSR